MGQEPFVRLHTQLASTPRLRLGPIAFDGVGIGVVCLLSALRARLPWFPLHPVGYAMANTLAYGQTPAPFFIAWLVKSLVLRWGGMRLYRRSLPFFLGLILGDMANGAFYTLMAAFVHMNVYPVNW
jgi:hypothetical protein